MSTRLTKDEAFMGVAYVLSLRGTCARRKVGAVLVDSAYHVIATGYNGNAAGDSHCIDTPCAGANLPSGSGLDVCEAIHAEQNALVQCKDVFKIDTLYCTTMPCMHCAKMLRNTSLRRVVYEHDYPDSEKVKLYLIGGGVIVDQFKNSRLTTVMLTMHPAMPPMTMDSMNIGGLSQ